MANWIDSKPIFDIVEKSAKRDGSWSWARNMQCKYIDLRIDMRDGHCILKDRDGNEIPLSKLEYQHGIPLKKE